jgi:hypothetical protein
MGGVRVGLLYDSVSANTGDIAIGIAGRQELARHGIDDVVVLDPFAPDAEPVDVIIVGGGELIRPDGDEFYDAFQHPDGAILNAVGVSRTAGALDYLEGYDYVSARSSAEAAVLRRYVQDVHVLPCTTTTLESEPFDLDVDPDEELVGIHLVPHTLTLCPDLVEIIDAIPQRKVFIPFTHYNYDDSFMRALPFDRTNAIHLPRLAPLELHSVIGQMKYVVTSSLHATLFAYAQNVPFVTAHQEKVLNYFTDRGLTHLVYASDDQLRRGLAEVQSGKVDFAEQVAADRAAVHETYATFVELIGRRVTGRRQAQRRATTPRQPLRRVATQRHNASSVRAMTGEEVERNVEHLRAEQRARVIENRDLTVHHVTRRLVQAQGQAAAWHNEADRLASELAVAQAALDERRAVRLAGRLQRRAIPGRVLRGVLRSISRHGLRSGLRMALLKSLGRAEQDAAVPSGGPSGTENAVGEPRWAQPVTSATVGSRPSTPVPRCGPRTANVVAPGTRWMVEPVSSPIPALMEYEPSPSGSEGSRKSTAAGDDASGGISTPPV